MYGSDSIRATPAGQLGDLGFPPSLVEFAATLPAVRRTVKHPRSAVREDTGRAALGGAMPSPRRFLADCSSASESPPLFSRAASRNRRRYVFANKIMLITGVSRTPSHDSSRQKDPHVPICARDEAEPQRAEGAIARFGAKILGIPCDHGPHRDRGHARRGPRRLGPVDVVTSLFRSCAAGAEPLQQLP